MKYFLQNPEIDQTIREIRKIIRLSMNGVVSDAMKEKGVIYKQNYGVQIPRLKQIAASYTSNHDLAQRLWALKIRETMILATLLQPTDKFTKQNAEDWLKDIHHIELAEQTCMNLFSKLTYADEWAMRCILSENLWEQIVGFTLITRVREQISVAQAEEITKRATALLDTDNFQLYKSISVCLARLCRNRKEVAERILTELNSMGNSEKESYRYALAEIKAEISFLDF